jgi:hypothetical protein
MPNGQYPSILPGQVLTAALLASMLSSSAWKTSATTYTTTLTSDPDLTVPVAASAMCTFDCFVSYTSTLTSNSAIEYNFAIPSGATLVGNAVAYVGGAINLSGNGLADNSVDAKGGTSVPIWATGTLITGTTAGSVTAQFKQTSGTLTIAAGSRMSLRRIQ